MSQAMTADPTTGRHRLYQSKLDLVRERLKEGALLQTKVYVTIRIPRRVKAAPTAGIGPLAFLSFGRGKGELKAKESIETEIKEVFQNLKSSFEGQGFETNAMTVADKYLLVHQFLNPERSEVPEIDDKAKSSDLSERFALTDFIETRKGVHLGRTRLRVGTLKTYPEASIPGLTALFSAESTPVHVVLTLMVLSQGKEKERLTRKQRLATGMAGGNAVRNLSAESQLRDIEDTLSSLITSGEKLFAASLHLVVFERPGDEGSFAFEKIIDSAEKLGSGCQWFEETVGAYPVFFGILPLAPTFITRPKRILTSNLSDFLPVYGIGPGHKEASVLFETPFQSVIGYSLFEKSPSANGILIGSTGSGKSTLACGLILGMCAGNRPDTPSAFVIDVGNSFKRTILYLGGSSLDLSPESGTLINPFDLESGQSRPGPEKVKFLTALFDEILGDAGNLSKLERALLETEIFLFYDNDRPKTLSGFRDHLTGTDSQELRRLAKLLSLWCKPHPYGLLFDGETNVTLTAPHLHWELKGCQRYPDLLRVAMLVVMNQIWMQIKARFPRRSIVPIDECHTIIRPSGDGRANSSARWIDDCFRQMRKFSSAALALSQTAKDLKNDDIGDGILANAPNRLILRQRGDEKTLREDLKLNAQELKEVFLLSQVRGAFSEFYLHSESIKGTLIYRPTPLELWLSTTHPPDNSLLIEEQKSNPELGLQDLMDHMAEKYPYGAEGGLAA